MNILKDIKGYEGLYKCSSDGQIFSVRNNRFLKPCYDTNGYSIVVLAKDKKHTTRTIHRLVAENWLADSYQPKYEVNHKDGNKKNNCIENLEWVSKKENIRHAMRMGLLVFNTTKIALEKRKKVHQIDIATNEIINTFDSAHEAARKTTINRGNICSCCRNEKEKAGNFKWQYAI